ncbi:MAG: glycosyltransferase [Acidimicrobiales bacterium]
MEDDGVRATQATVVMTLWSEPPGRLQRTFAALAAQEGLRAGLEVVVAVDPADAITRVETTPSGAIRSVRIVDNPGGARSAGLNRAVRASSTPWICRVDARSVVPPDYVARCVELLQENTGAGVVGGLQCPTPAGPGVRARAIARALANPWALGGAAYRTGMHAGAVDTVYLGAFRRDELLTLGGYDERLDANEDFELCQRYRTSGRTVWLDPRLRVPYTARADLHGLWSQYLAFGRSKVRFWRATGERPNGRQRLALTMGAVAAGAGGVTVALHPATALWAGVAAVGGLIVLDAAARQPAGPLVRMAAVPAYAILLGAWLAGVAVETVMPRRPPRAAGRERASTA